MNFSFYLNSFGTVTQSCLTVALVKKLKGHNLGKTTNRAWGEGKETNEL